MSFSITDKLWPADKYGFQFAYAIRLGTKWKIKRVNEDWEDRRHDWKPSDEAIWGNVLLSNVYNTKINHIIKLLAEY